jgi:hypothetical protein
MEEGEGKEKMIIIRSKNIKNTMLIKEKKYMNNKNIEEE